MTLALVGEVGELAELLQWLPAADRETQLRKPQREARLGQELADVLLYLIRLADVAAVDLANAASAKMRANAPASRSMSTSGRRPLVIEAASLLLVSPL